MYKICQISALTLVLNTVYFDKVTVSLCQMQTLDSDRQLPGPHRFYQPCGRKKRWALGTSLGAPGAHKLPLLQK